MYVIELIGPGKRWEESLPDARGLVPGCEHMGGALQRIADAGYSILINNTDQYLGELPSEEERAAFRQVIERLAANN